MLTPSAELAEYQAEVRRLLARSWPLSRSRDALENGRPLDPAAWSALTGLGAVGLLVPGEFGGGGAGAAEAALVCEELGRVLLPVPYASTAVTAARLLSLLSPGPARDRYLAGIASGTTIATVAFLDDSGRWPADRIAVQAEPPDAEATGADPAPAATGGPGWALYGTAPYVADAAQADLILVVAKAPDGLGVFAVADASAPEHRQLACLDLGQPASRLSFEAVPALRLPVAGDLAAVMADVVATTIACLTASAVGGAERCLEMSAQYAKARVQFGRPIGAYQAIKHRCADMFAAVQSARSAVYHLLGQLGSGAGPEETALAASIAKAYCSDAYVRCARDTLQIHGGIGFTWEHDTHLYLRRAMTHAHLLGDATYHRQQIARHLGVLRKEAPWN
jgi:alkylation response protein AidB-like acyl-CoA dehydrogenase